MNLFASKLKSVTKMTILSLTINILLLTSVLGAPAENYDSTCQDETDFFIQMADPTNLLLSKSNSTSYAIEITRNNLQFQTGDCKPLQVHLTAKESEGIQKLCLEFIKLLDASKLSQQEEAEVLDWKDLNPIITLTNSEISIRFVKMAEPPNSSTNYDESKRYVFWQFLTQFVKNVFQKKLNETNGSVDGDPWFESAANDSSQYQNFLSTLWKIIKISVNYAENNFNGWTTTSAPNEKSSEADESLKENPQAVPPLLLPHRNGRTLIR